MKGLILAHGGAGARVVTAAQRGCLADALGTGREILKRDGTMYVTAIEPITKGDEITFDYSTILADDNIWEMDCNCGEKTCRTRIKKFSSLPKRLKETYIRLGIVPKYILRI